MECEKVILQLARRDQPAFLDRRRQLLQDRLYDPVFTAAAEEERRTYMTRMGQYIAEESVEAAMHFSRTPGRLLAAYRLWAPAAL